MRSAPVVALVASAGGVGAVSGVLAALPVAFEAAVIVLIHQAPDRASHLEQVLARGCRLPVVVAEHGSTLRAGRVVVVPPGKHLLVTPGSGLALIAAGAFPPNRPSADLLLTTLAIAVGRLAVAVVLSGTGHDGATGATAIHAFGGTVLAADEASSAHFSMPSAAIERTGVVDHVLTLEDIAEHLVNAIQ